MLVFGGVRNNPSRPRFNILYGSPNPQASLVCRQSFSFNVAWLLRIARKTCPTKLHSSNGGEYFKFLKRHQNWSGNFSDAELWTSLICSFFQLDEVFDPRLMYTMTALRFSQDGNAALFALQDTAFTIQHCSMAYGKYKCKA